MTEAVTVADLQARLEETQREWQRQTADWAMRRAQWRKREKMDAATITELENVVRDLLQGGQHDGPCTNEPDEACELHLGAAKHRRDAAELHIPVGKQRFR